MQQPATTIPAGSGASPVSDAYKVDISRGERIGRVSSEWFSRPGDERYLSLGALHAAVRARADRATARTVETSTLRVEANRDDAGRMALIVPGRDEPVAPTHWSFGQMCGLVGAPAGYLRQLPAPLAGITAAVPDRTLQQIAAQLEAMRERTSRGGTRWHPSSVRNLLARAEKLGLAGHAPVQVGAGLRR